MKAILISILFAIFFVGCSPKQTQFDAMVYWEPSIENDFVSQYEIEVHMGNGVSHYNTNLTEYILKLPHNTPCFARVKAIDYNGNSSEYSTYSDTLLVKK